MSRLAPCPGCNRHVRVVESVCPFCACALELAATPAPPLPRTRLGRGATFAFGASLLSVGAVAACKDNTLPPPVVSETAAPVYGAPPAPPDGAAVPPDSDAGSSLVNGGGGSGSEGGAAGLVPASAGGPATGRHLAPMYGGPPPYPSGKAPVGPAKRILDDR